MGTREGGREGPTVRRGDPPAPDPAGALETPGQPKTRLTMSTEPVRDGTQRGSPLCLAFLPP